MLYTINRGYLLHVFIAKKIKFKTGNPLNKNYSIVQYSMRRSEVTFENI